MIDEVKIEEIDNQDLQKEVDFVKNAIAEEKTAEADYENIAREDIASLREEFDELMDLTDITELDNPLRYAALRDLGLSPKEAYLATQSTRRKSDNRSHLYPAPKISSQSIGVMPERELEAARELFSDISDAEIRKLYRKVTK